MSTDDQCIDLGWKTYAYLVDEVLGYAAASPQPQASRLQTFGYVIEVQLFLFFFVFLQFRPAVYPLQQCIVTSMINGS